VVHPSVPKILWYLVYVFNKNLARWVFLPHEYFLGLVGFALFNLDLRFLLDLRCLFEFSGGQFRSG
jgi:hypothetical protein